MAIPKIVQLITSLTDGYIVGSAADPTNNNPKDWDVIVPHANWHIAAGVIAAYEKNPNITSFGGWRIEENGMSIDIWPDDIGRIMYSAKAKWVWHYKTGVRWKRET